MPKDEAKRGGYSGSKPAAEVGPPAKIPSGSIPQKVEIIPLEPKRIINGRGEPFRKVKQKARYMLDSAPATTTYVDLKLIISRLIETAPQQALDALCDVLGDD